MPDDDDAPAWLREARARELAQFPVGTEVVVTLAGECPPGLYRCHYSNEDGRVGVVSAVVDVGADGHRLIVDFRKPLPINHGVTLGNNVYTPGELRVFDIMAEIERLKDEARAREDA